MSYTDVEIITNITNGGCNIANGRYPINTPLHIELTPNKLYGITDTKTPKLLYCYRSNGNSAFSQSFVKSDIADIWYLDTTLKYYQLPDVDMFCKVTYTYNKKYSSIKNNLIRCNSDVDGVYPFEQLTITLTADEGCEFKIAPTISYYVMDKSTIPWKEVYKDFFFEMVNERNYTYTFTPDSNNSIYTVYGEAVEKTDITDKYGMITVYKPTKEILNELSKIRFHHNTPKEINTDMGNIYIMEKEYIDTAEYILSLRKMYFSIETSVKENISLGMYNTEIECDVIGNDVVVLNMGSILLTGRYQNIMDYKNTDIEAYLPFVGFVELHPADYMDKEITLTYQVNIITGEALAILYTNNHVMKTFNCNASFAVPYRNTDSNVSSLESNTNYLLSENPFIYVKSYNEAVPDNKLPYNDTKFYAQFANVNGYTEAVEIDFTVVNSFITTSEIDDIKQLLNSGVYL